MGKKLILNKYRNEYGKQHRKEYEAGKRSELCRRYLMRSYLPRKDKHCGTITTFLQDNLVFEFYQNIIQL